jgi:hypothetical protein
MWQDLSDSIIEAEDPPLAEISGALRECDISNAESPLPTGHDGAVGSWVQASVGQSLAMRISLPHAIPAGWDLVIPVAVEVGAGGGAPRIEMRIGANRGPQVLVSGPGTHAVLVRCAIPAGVSGTEQNVAFYVHGSPSYQTRINAADKYHAAQASIRRPVG